MIEIAPIAMKIWPKRSGGHIAMKSGSTVNASGEVSLQKKS